MYREMKKGALAAFIATGCKRLLNLPVYLLNTEILCRLQEREREREREREKQLETRQAADVIKLITNAIPCELNEKLNVD